VLAFLKGVSNLDAYGREYKGNSWPELPEKKNSVLQVVLAENPD